MTDQALQSRLDKIEAEIAMLRRAVEHTNIGVYDCLLAACHEYGTVPEDVCGRGRHKSLVMTRRLYSALCRHALKHVSYPEIAAGINGTGHSTVLSAARAWHKQPDQKRWRDACARLGVAP